MSSSAHVDPYSKTLFGFWVYLMTDCVLFSMLFATYAVLHANTFGGPSGKEIFHLPYILGETLVLLTSSFTCGLGMLSANAAYSLAESSGAKKAYRQHTLRAIAWFALTFVLGATFLILELSEFSKLVMEGDSWKRSAFLSSYFTLVGTHGLHISVGLLWMAVLLYQLWQRNVTQATFRRVSCLSLFWHFLDVVWIFIFTLVYLMGVM